MKEGVNVNLPIIPLLFGSKAVVTPQVSVTVAVAKVQVNVADERSL